MFGLLKPKWQHKNPKVRCKAIDTLDVDAAELIELALNDENLEVRRIAIEKLEHLPTLLKVCQCDSSEADIARRRLALLAPDAPAEIEILHEVVQLIEDKTILVEIVKKPSHRMSVRKQALLQLPEEDDFLAFVTAAYPRELRQVVVEHITDQELLKAAQKHLTNQDKRLRQQVQMKLDEIHACEQRLREREKLCTRLEALGRSPNWRQEKTILLTCQQQWKKLEEASKKSWKDALEQVSIRAYKERYNVALKKMEACLANAEKDEALLRPYREARDNILYSLERLLNELKTEPFLNSAEKVDTFLQLLAKNWEGAGTLPEPEDFVYTQKYKRLHQQIAEIRLSIDGDIQRLQHFDQLVLAAQELRERKQAVSQKQVRTLQNRWEIAERPAQGLDKLAELEQLFNRHQDSLQARLLQQEKDKAANLKVIEQQLEHVGQFIEEDEFGQAIDTFDKTQALFKNTPDLSAGAHRNIEKRISYLAPRIHEMRDWRNWGTHQARHSLIDEAQRLAEDKEINPDDRAKAVKQLRDRWKELDRTLPGSGKKLWKEFDEACGKAYAPCQQYFDEQAAQRDQNLAQRAEICADLESLESETDWDHVNWRALTKDISKHRKRWKKAGTVNRKNWTTINDRFNQAMDALEVHLAQERRHSWLQREALVKEAQALIEDKDVAQAIEKAKQLQQRWSPTVVSRAGEEQKLWRTFREAIDAVFERSRQERDATRQKLQDNVQQKEAYCEELETLAEAGGEAVLQAQHRLDDIDAAFHQEDELPKRTEKAIKQRYKRALSAFHKALKEALWQRELEQLQLLQHKARLCRISENSVILDGAENNDTVLTQWKTLPELKDAALEKAIRARRDLITAGQCCAEARLQDNLQAHLVLCLKLEILLDCETPDEYRGERMQLQVSRLQEGMRSRNHQSEKRPLGEQALPMIQQWYLIGAIPADDGATALQQRFESILEKFAPSLVSS